MSSAHRVSILVIALSVAEIATRAAHADGPKPAPHPAPKPQHATHATAHAAKSQAPPHYAQYVRGWHAPAPDRTATIGDNGRTMLALYALNTGDRVELEAASDAGGFSAFDLDRATRVLREPGSGNEHPIEPRLLDVIYRIQRHFDAQEIRVVSGYRTPHGAGSNHGRGRAMDIVVPGATDEDVAKFARESGFVGVGIYPTSGFVHVDVRDRSYFWVDTSGPGKRTRERGILGDVAAKSDANATARGEHGIGIGRIGADVDAALRACVAPVTTADEETDDDVEAN